MGSREEEEIEWNELINDPQRLAQWNSMRKKRNNTEAKPQEFFLGNYVKDSKPSVAVGNVVLKAWIFTIVVCALIMGAIFLSDPSEFSDPKPERQCTTIEVNGEAVDTCEYLVP